MKDLFLVTVSNTPQKLIGKSLNDPRVESLFPTEATHVLFEVEFEELKNEDEFAVGVDDFSESDHVGMGQLFEDGYLADGC